MTTPPSRWSERLLGLALTVLAIAVMLNIAVQLIMDVLPVILVVAGVVLFVFVCWSFFRSRL
jgi:xanthine/uracil permease